MQMVRTNGSVFIGTAKRKADEDEDKIQRSQTSTYIASMRLASLTGCPCVRPQPLPATTSNAFTIERTPATDPATSVARFASTKLDTAPRSVI